MKKLTIRHSQDPKSIPFSEMWEGGIFCCEGKPYIVAENVIQIPMGLAICLDDGRCRHFLPSTRVFPQHGTLNLKPMKLPMMR